MRKGPLGDRMHRFSQDSLQGRYREITYSIDLAKDKFLKKRLHYPSLIRASDLITENGSVPLGI